ncbi:MAG TPA: 2-oxoacid:acceptor oxidoreductase family protein [Synergistales bacterium]|nr:2-oxoacid:acceptor oxidoreductase family protein [Synergistales bacterium]
MAKFLRGLIAAGFGGQGVLLLGQIVAHAAMKEGRYVTWIPSYGPEMRGGTANCSVAISDEEIGSPVVPHPDCLVIMNQPSLAKFEPDLKSGGTLLYNSDLVTYPQPRTDIRVVPVPCNSIALELGNEKVANVVTLGALAAASDLVSVEGCKETLAELMGKKKAALVEINMTAFDRGVEIARKALGQ